MTDRPTCSTCKFWDTHTGAAWGSCHEDSPQISDVGGVWPVTGTSDWCGKHKLKLKENDDG